MSNNAGYLSQRRKSFSKSKSSSQFKTHRPPHTDRPTLQPKTFQNTQTSILLSKASTLQADFDDTQKLAFSNLSQIQVALLDHPLNQDRVNFLLDRLSTHLQKLGHFGEQYHTLLVSQCSDCCLELKETQKCLTRVTSQFEKTQRTFGRNLQEMGRLASQVGDYRLKIQTSREKLRQKGIDEEELNATDKF